jgi:hypothetical protein
MPCNLSLPLLVTLAYGMYSDATPPKAHYTSSDPGSSSYGL